MFSKDLICVINDSRSARGVGGGGGREAAGFDGVEVPLASRDCLPIVAREGERCPEGTDDWPTLSRSSASSSFACSEGPTARAEEPGSAYIITFGKLSICVSNLPVDAFPSSIYSKVHSDENSTDNEWPLL